MEHPATSKSDTPTIETTVEANMHASDIRYSDTRKNIKLLHEFPNFVPKVPRWKIKLDRANKAKAVRHANFDLSHTLNKHPDIRSTINLKRNSTGQRFNAHPAKKTVPLMSLNFHEEMSLATPVLKTNVAPEVTNHNKPTENQRPNLKPPQQ